GRLLRRSPDPRRQGREQDQRDHLELHILPRGFSEEAGL
ncbi:MAG: Cytochrome oxidase biogenesis protein Cox11-CtaG, copper delivery to Cox1, partial [uncultured Microvirga sp.]